ncbi:MAG: hypothetical protein AABO57_01975 [Acidobacteriota bacterium]
MSVEPRQSQQSLSQKLSRLADSNLFWGGGVAVALAGYAFELGSAPKASVVLLVLAWLMITISVCRHDFFEGKQKPLKLVGNSFLSGLLAAVLAVAWIALRAQGQSESLLEKYIGTVWPYLEWVAVRSYQYLIGFLIAFLSIGVVRLWKRRKRRQEANVVRRLSALGSQAKGWLDHARDREIARQRYSILAGKIGNEIGSIARTADAAAKSFGRAKDVPGMDRAASEAATRLHKHADKLESTAQEFESITSLWIDSNAEFVKWSTGAGRSADSIALERNQYAEMLTRTDASLASLKTFRNTQIGIQGISQELNAAAGRLIVTLDKIDGLMTKSRDHWQRAIEILNAATPTDETKQ